MVFDAQSASIMEGFFPFEGSDEEIISGTK